MIHLTAQRRARLVWLLQNKPNRRTPKEIRFAIQFDGDKKDWLAVIVGTLCVVAVFVILNTAN